MSKNHVRSCRALTFAALVGLCSASSASAGIAYGGDPFNNRVFEVNLATGALTGAVPVSLPGFDVFGVTALTANPIDQSIWGVVRTATGNSGRKLVTMNPVTGAATLVGDVPNGFSSLSFNSAGVLYGMTGQGGSPASTLFTVSTLDGSTTFVMGPILTGADGEVIAFGPSNTLYHSSGNGTANFSTLNLNDNTTTFLGTHVGEIFGMGYDADTGIMYGTDINSDLYSLDLSTGARTFIGGTQLPNDGDFIDVRGLAIIPTPGVAALLILTGMTAARRRR